MTALGSANSAKSGGVFYKFLPYYLNKLRFLKPQFIMNSIFALLSYPLAGGFLIALASIEQKTAELGRYYMEINDTNNAAYKAALDAEMTIEALTLMSFVIAGLCLVGMFVFTFVTTVRAFRYLYDKTAVDMDYSLPVNHNTRFFGDLSAVLTTSILPHLIAVFIGMILVKITISIGESFALEPEEAQLIIDLVYQGMFVGLFACVMQLAFSLMMISFCGRKAEAFLYPVLINIAVPFIHIVGIYIVESNIFGTSLSTMETMLSATSTSPVGMVFMSMYSIMDIKSKSSYIKDYNTTLPIFRAEFLIPAILLTLVFFAGAYFLIKYRRNERVGMPYVYKGLSVVIPGVILLAVSLPMWNMVFYQFSNAMHDDYSYTPNSAAWLIGLLISTFILYVIMELISGRNFKKFHISVLKWACTIAATAGIAALLIFTNGFGRGGYIPETDPVAYADMYIQKNDGDYLSFGLSNATDDEVINVIREVHKKILDGEQVHEYTIYQVDIDYSLNSGEAVGRRYYLTKEQFDEIVKLAVTPATAYHSLVYDDLSLPLTHKNWRLTEIGTEENRVRTNEITLDELTEALKKDLENVTSDDIFGYKSGNMYYSVYIDFDMGNDNRDGEHYFYAGGGENEYRAKVNIYSWMDNTIEYLASHGVTLDLSRFRTAFIMKFEDENSGDHYSINNDVMMALSDGRMTEYINENRRYYDDSYLFDGKAVEILPYTFGKLDVDSAAYNALLDGVYGDGFGSKYALYLCTKESYDDLVNNADDYSVRRLTVSEEYYTLAESLLQEGLVYEYNGETDWITAYGKFVDFDALKGTQSAGTGEAA